MTTGFEAVAQYAKGDCTSEVVLLHGGLEEEDRFEPWDGEGDEDEADGRGEGHDEARRRGSQNGHICSVLAENERGGNVRVRRAGGPKRGGFGSSLHRLYWCLAVVLLIREKKPRINPAGRRRKAEKKKRGEVL